MHDREWYERRLTGWGGSDAAPLLGLSRWKPARSIVEEKIRRIIPDPDAPERLRLRVGREMEPMMARHLVEMAKERGLTPDPDRRGSFRFWRSKKLYRMHGYPFVITNVDGFLGDALVEMKTDEFGYEPWGDEDGEPSRVIPPFYYAQVQHGLAATGRERALLFVMIGYHERRLYDVPADEGYIADLIDYEEEQWKNVMIGRSRLDTDPDADIDDLLPELDGTAASTEWVKKRHPANDDVILPATAEQTQLIEQLRLAVRIGAAQDLTIDSLKNRLRDIIGANAGISSSAGTVTWKKPKDSTVIGWEQIAKAFREIMEHELQSVLSGDFATNQLSAAHSTDGLRRTPVDFELLDTIEGLYTSTKENGRRFEMPRSWTKQSDE